MNNQPFLTTVTGQRAVTDADSPPRPNRRVVLSSSLAMALALVGGAWYIGEREGFTSIGKGGTNLQLLPRVGEPAPDVSLMSLSDGRRVQLSGYRGRPVWLNFWGSWCPPCRSEFPDLQAAYQNVLAPSGVALLAISLDEPAEAAATYFVRNGGTFTLITDPVRQDTGAAYPIANFPTHILIDPDGIVRAVILAPIDQVEIERAAQLIIRPQETT